MSREMSPSEAAALYLWSVGDGRREPPKDLTEARLVGSALAKLIERAGDRLASEPLDLEPLGPMR